MTSIAFNRFGDKVQDVQRLLNIYSFVKKEIKNDEARVLNKSAMVLLSAAWETYIESLLEESVLFLLDRSFPGSQKPIQYAALSELLRIGVQKEVKRLHTPKSETMKNLFSSLLGIQDIRTAWGRGAQNYDAAANALDELLEKRHRIVHGALSDPEFSRSEVLAYRKFLEITVRKTDSATAKHLKVITGMIPW